MSADFNKQTPDQRRRDFQQELTRLGLSIGSATFETSAEMQPAAVLLGTKREVVIVRLHDEHISLQLSHPLPDETAQSLLFGMGSTLRVVSSPGDKSTTKKTVNSGALHYHVTSWSALRALLKIYIQTFGQSSEQVNIAEEIGRLAAAPPVISTPPKEQPAPTNLRTVAKVEDALADLWKDVLTSHADNPQAVPCCLEVLRTSARLELNRLQHIAATTDSTPDYIILGIVDQAVRGALWTAMHNSGVKLAHPLADTLMHVYRDRILLMSPTSGHTLSVLWSAPKASDDNSDEAIPTESPYTPWGTMTNKP